MRLMIGNYFSTSFNSLRRNRMRTLLTTTGIAIGIASITTILALTVGVTSAVDRQVEQVGGNVAVVLPGAEKQADLTRPILPQQYNTSTLTEVDLDTIQRVDDSLYVAPIMTVNSNLTTGTTTVTSGTIVATTPDLAETTDLPVAEGQFLDETTGDNVAIIGQQLAINLFGTENPIGQRFEVRDNTLTVIGVLKRMSNPVNYNNIDFDNAVVVSLDRGKTLHQGRTQIQQINIHAPDEATLTAALTEIDETLTESHGEKDFRIIRGDEVAATTNRTFQWVAAVMTAIAAISLVVGGIGVMNIMLVGVAERTREIGIRKAVGASNYSIVMQFLVEALMLSFIGGIIGLVAGVVLAFSIALGMYFAPVFNWQIIAISLSVSLVIGVVFGLYPAIRAARKDPIESLRQYR